MSAAYGLEPRAVYGDAPGRTLSVCDSPGIRSLIGRRSGLLYEWW